MLIYSPLRSTYLEALTRLVSLCFIYIYIYIYTKREGESWYNVTNNVIKSYDYRLTH